MPSPSWPSTTPRAPRRRSSPRTAAAIATAALARTGAAPVMVDLGAGNCAKAASLFGAAGAAPLRGGGHLGGLPAPGAAGAAARASGAWTWSAWGWTFPRGCSCPPTSARGPRWCSIRARASATSRPTMRCACCARRATLAAGGALLIGVDLVKPATLLEAAYDDDLGRHRRLQPEPAEAPEPAARRRLRRARLAPRGAVRRAATRVSRCTSRHGATPTCAGATASARFAAGERIHTENSYKWNGRRLSSALLRDAGFAERAALERRARLVRRVPGQRLSVWRWPARPGVERR